VLVLVMAAPRPREIPAIVLKHANYLANLHWGSRIGAAFLAVNVEERAQASTHG